jgi:hypothetical protein
LATTGDLGELDLQHFRFGCGLEVTVRAAAAAPEGYEILAGDGADAAHVAFHLGLDAPDAPMRYRVLRQDDHGGRREMRRFGSRCEAEAFVAAYTARLHHQVYWCEALP